jgi:hypothetical protein
MRWRQNHSEVPFWMRMKKISKLMHGGWLARKNLSNRFVEAFTTLGVELISAHPKLFYLIEDMDWLSRRLAVSMLLLPWSCSLQ